VPAVLRSKVNPNCHTHRLAIDEADLLMSVTGDYAMLQALAAHHGFVLARVECPASESLFGAYLASSAMAGDLAGVLAAALSDGQVTNNEAAAISGAGQALQAAVIHLVQLVCHAAKAPRAPQVISA